MGKIKNYHQIIWQEFEHLADYRSSAQPDIGYRFLYDENYHSFILLTIGWHNNKYHHFIMYHVELKNGKVIVQDDRTDAPIADRLEELGISADDIVCNYFAPPEKNILKAAA